MARGLFTKPIRLIRQEEWRKRSEGLKRGCTAKGSKEGAVNVNFMVGISYHNGVVLCEQYSGAINGRKMADMIHSAFPPAFQKSIDPKGKRVLQDGCPRQNSKKARDALHSIGAKVLKIPARSPDLNPIENFFNSVTQKLREQALANDIRKETCEQFSERVKKTMMEYPSEEID